MKLRFITVLLTFTCSIAIAQDLLIMDANLHTQSDAGVIENTDILIKNGRIAKLHREFPPIK